MKALIFDEPKKPVVTQVQSPQIDENEVLIQSRRVGICHSDYELLAGQYIIPISYPVIPGHEWVGDGCRGRQEREGAEARRPRRRRMRYQYARAHSPFRVLDGRRQSRIFRGPAGMAPQVARRRGRCERRSHRAIHLRILRRAAQRRHECVGNGRDFRRRDYRSRVGRRRHRDGRARNRGGSSPVTPRYRQAAGGGRHCRPVRRATRSRRSRRSQRAAPISSSKLRAMPPRWRMCSSMRGPKGASRW